MGSISIDQFPVVIDHATPKVQARRWAGLNLWGIIGAYKPSTSRIIVETFSRVRVELWPRIPITRLTRWSLRSSGVILCARARATRSAVVLSSMSVTPLPSNRIETYWFLNRIQLTLLKVCCVSLLTPCLVASLIDYESNASFLQCGSSQDPSLSGSMVQRAIATFEQAMRPAHFWIGAVPLTLDSIASMALPASSNGNCAIAKDSAL